MARASYFCALSKVCLKCTSLTIWRAISWVTCRVPLELSVNSHQSSHNRAAFWFSCRDYISTYMSWMKERLTSRMD